jgi:hydroxysqualene dehydroxylase
MSGRHVVVIGGGLAGITAAIDLCDAGHAVTLLESRPRLGGAASSYRRAGMTVDNGQHVFLRCCAFYQQLLARLDVTGQVGIQERFDVTVLAGTGLAGTGATGAGPTGTGPAGPARARLRRSSLPSPLHLTAALARYPLLSLTERVKVARAALAFRFADPTSPELDRQRLGDWLAARGQAERARRRLWDLFIISALNISGDDASTGLAAKVIKTALLGRKDAADIGMARVPLGRLHSDATAALLARLGASVQLGARAASVEQLPSGGFRIGLSRGDLAGPGEAAGQALLADAVVLAVPPGQAARLAGSAGVAEAASFDRLGYSPIVNVHVIYDRQVMDLPFAAAVDSPVQWVFDKTKHAGLPAGQYLAVSVSAADDLVDTPTAEVREMFLPALEELFPAAAGAGITDFFVTRERRATFRQEPGSGALRPGAATSVPGLALAGAWTDTGWPDTMEGAVRSGHNAAQVLARGLASLPAVEFDAARDAAWSGAS